MAINRTSSPDRDVPDPDARPSRRGVRSLLAHGPGAVAGRRAHQQMKKHSGLWISLPFDGIQHDGAGALLEYRRCPTCGSTLARPTSALHAVTIVAALSEIHTRSLAAIVCAGEAVLHIA